jgi:hypothetical protein
MSINNPTFHDKDSDSKFPSLNLVFDLTKERIKGQGEQVKAVDDKANFIFVSSTALVSASLVLQSVVVKSSPNQPTSSAYCPMPTNGFLSTTLLNTILILVLLLVYISVIITAYLAYKNRKFGFIPEPDELYSTYLRKEQNVTKEHVLQVMRSAYNMNEKTIDSKVFCLKLAFILLICEVIVLVLYLSFQIIC